MAEKIRRFVRAGVAVGTMRRCSYLAIGGVSMGIAGSIVDQPFFERYLGMRVETVDMTEFLRRIGQGTYDDEEYTHALTWVKATATRARTTTHPLACVPENTSTGSGKRA